MKVIPAALIAAALLCSTAAQARQGDLKRMRLKPSPVYVRIGAGYGFAYGGQTALGNKPLSGREAFTAAGYTGEVRRASFGSGAAAMLAGGYMINAHVGIELGVYAVLAPPKYTYDGMVPGFGNARTYTAERAAQLPVSVIPALLLKTGNKLQLYSRTGIVLPVADKLTVKETRSGTGPGQTTEVFSAEITSRFSIGFQGAVGLSYALGSHLAVWAEGNLISRSAYAKRSELTGYTEDGVDRLTGLSASARITEYEFSYEIGNVLTPYQPAREATFTVPFSSIGVLAGIRYNF